MVAPIARPGSDRPVRVLFVDHETRLSGGEQDLLDLARALHALEPQRYHLHAALPGPGPLADALLAADVRIHEFVIDPALRSASRWVLGRNPMALLRMVTQIVRSARSIGRLMDEVAPDVVHTNSMKAHLLALAPARFRGIPLIWHVRDILEQGWLLRLVRFLGGRGPRRIACISRRVAEQFAGSGAEAVTEVVYNGIEVSRFRHVPGFTMRVALGAGEGEVLVGMVGQIARWKGQDTFIEAAVRVAADHPGCRFAIVGECLFPENEAEYEEALHLTAEPLGDRICWAGWSDDPPGVMNALDIVVHISRLPEPFGRVIVEGMAAGKPVIASSSGAGPEIVQEGEGLIVPPDDPEALAEAIRVLVTHPDNRAKMGEAAREGAGRFDISHTAAGVSAIYRSLLPA